MDLLPWIFLESRLALAVLAMFVLLGLGAYWRRTLRIRPLAVGAVLIGALFILQALVTTRRERAIALLSRVEHSVLASNAGGIRPLLHPEFRAGQRDAAEFIEFVRGQLRRLEVRTLRRRHLELVTSQPDGFTAEVAYTASVATEAFRGFVVSRWYFAFARDDGTWRISAIEPRALGGVSIRTWSDLERY